MTDRPSRRVRRAVLAAGTTCLAGFGALVGFSAITVTPPELRGLFDYLSATWGDAILLPVSVGALVYAYDAMERRPHDRALLLFGGLAGGAVGALTQVQWLSDDDPELNWTLPTAHHFNAAGVYHAVFLTATSAAIAALWAGVLSRWTRGDRRVERRDVNQAIGVAVASSLGFVALLLVDNRNTVDTKAAHATVTAVAGATFVAVAGITIASWLRRRSRRSGH